MKTRILGMLLCLLCLPGCGDKAQKSHKTAGSVQQEQADTMTLGTSGFPKEIKKAWRVSLQDSMVYVTLMNTAEDGRELQMPYGVFPCEVFHYGNGRWKNVTTQLAPSEQHYKKKEASTSYPFDFLRESAPDDPSHIYPIPKPETELTGYKLVELIRTIRPNETAHFSFPLYNGTTDSIEKGLYRLTFYIDGKPCHIVFEL